MNNQYKISVRQVIFSKWSRKGYAIFASLKKVVKIARLSIDICNLAIRKSISLLPFLYENLLKADNTDYKYLEQFSLELDLAQLCIINNSKSDIHFKENNNIYKPRPVLN